MTTIAQRRRRHSALRWKSVTAIRSMGMGKPTTPVRCWEPGRPNSQPHVRLNCGFELVEVWCVSVCLFEARANLVDWASAQAIRADAVGWLASILSWYIIHLLFAAPFVWAVADGYKCWLAECCCFIFDERFSSSIFKVGPANEIACCPKDAG